jgi:hypothetical protein
MDEASQGTVCDLCRVRGQNPPNPTVEQIRMTVRELHATVSVCTEHRAELEQFAATVMLARRPRTNDSTSFPRLRASEDREVIRRWAQSAGLPVAASGTISAAVLEAYREAHGTKRTAAAAGPVRRSNDLAV